MICIPKNQARSFIAGFTLVEVIIAVSISFLIISVIGSVVIVGQNSYMRGGNSAEITQNARVVLGRLSREIRQSQKIITLLPVENINPAVEIEFQDGHLFAVSETDSAQGGSSNTIILSPISSDRDDYYKDMFLVIISGTGAGQTRKISSYSGADKTAEVDQPWEIQPNASSLYKIDSSFYYIHYYRDDENRVLREVFTYCFSSDSVSCVSPETYVPFGSVPPGGQQLLKIILEQPRIIGEDIIYLRFYGEKIINIAMGLMIKDQTADFETNIFGRNL